MPTRLLDVDGVEIRGTVRLAEHDFPTSPRLEYLTLSHCWGNSHTTNCFKATNRLSKNRFPWLPFLLLSTCRSRDYSSGILMSLGSPRTSLVPANYMFSQREQFLWECVENEVDEYGAEEHADQPRSRFFNLTLIKPESMDIRAMHLFGVSKNILMFQTDCTKLLSVYTATKLTKPSDKLVAIKGIISRIQKSAELNSLVGMWEEILPAELLWKADSMKFSSQSASRVGLEYRPPS